MIAPMRAGTIEMVVCTLVWGTIGPIAKQLDVSSPVIVFFRLFLGLVVVASYLAIRGRLRELRPGTHTVALVSAGVTLAVHWTLQFEAFKRLDVATAILIVFLGPVLVAIVAPRILGEPRDAVALGALVAAVIGIALIASPGSRGGLDARGFAAALGSALLFAVLVLLGKHLTAHVTSPAIVVWQLAVASAVLSPSLFGADISAIAGAGPGLALLGLVHTGLLGIVFFHAVRALPAQHLSVLFYLEPASAVLYAWWWLAEQPSARTLAGGAMIVAAGLAIIILGRRTPSPPDIAPLEAA